MRLWGLVLVLLAAAGGAAHAQSLEERREKSAAMHERCMDRWRAEADRSFWSKEGLRERPPQRRLEQPPASFSSAFIERAIFVDKSLARRDFAGVMLVDVDLSGADLRGADFTGACLYSVDLSSAQLDGAILDEAVVSAGRWEFSVREGRRERVEYTAFVTESSSLDHASLRATRLRGAQIQTYNLSATDFTDADLTGAHIEEVSCTGWRCDWGSPNPRPILARTILDSALIGQLGQSGVDPPRSIKGLMLSSLSLAQAATFVADADRLTFYVDSSVIEASGAEIRAIAAQLPKVDATGFPAFDCAAAVEPADLLVCRSPRLGHYDRALKALWKALGRNPVEATATEAWRLRRAACRDTECLTNFYREQMVESASEQAEALGGIWGTYTEQAPFLDAARRLGGEPLARFVDLQWLSRSDLSLTDMRVEGIVPGPPDRGVYYGCDTSWASAKNSEGQWLFLHDYRNDNTKFPSHPFRTVADASAYEGLAFLVTPLAILVFGNGNVSCGSSYWSNAYFREDGGKP